MKEWSLQKRVLFMALAPLTVAVLLLALRQFATHASGPRAGAA
jgi:hypothetical protein